MGLVQFSFDHNDVLEICRKHAVRVTEITNKPRVYTYLEKYENTTLAKLCHMVYAAEKAYAENGDCEAMAAAVQNWAEQYEKILIRIEEPATSGDIAQMHMIKKRKEMSDETYRDICMETVGKNSAKLMMTYEAKMVIRQLNIYKMPKEELQSNSNLVGDESVAKPIIGSGAGSQGDTSLAGTGRVPSWKGSQ